MLCSLAPESDTQDYNVVALKFVKKFISLNCSRKDDFDALVNVPC